MIASVHWLRRERDRLHQTVCCGHVRPSVTVFMGMSKMGRTVLIFVIFGVKINSACYHEVFLTQKLLPVKAVMHKICDEFVYLPARQCSCSLSTRDNQLSGMRHTFVHFTRPLAPNSPDLNQMKTKFREKCSSGCGKQKFVKSVNWSSGCSMSDMVSSKVSSMMCLMNGTNVSLCV